MFAASPARSRARRLLAVSSVLLVIALGSTACSSAGSGAAAGSGTNASVTSGSHLDPGAFAAAMAQPNTVLIDVRTPAEFAAGHISGASNIDVESADFASQIASLDKTKTYALYCHSGRRSGIAMQLMQQAGFTNVYDLSGGIENWQSQGMSLVAS